jgi:uncharacterized protein YndB with AHSA1/START domain
MPQDPTLDLVISRDMPVTRAQLWAAWSDPRHLKEWWCPKPWTTEVKAFDFRPGGAFHTFMSGPDGGTSDNPGVFLEIVPLTRIVGTSQLLADFRPAPPSWMALTSVFTFEEIPGGTRVTGLAMHATREARDQHEQMGFQVGWGMMFDQMAAYAATL